jgi:uncharacterized protein (TIGR03067 family)
VRSLRRVLTGSLAFCIFGAVLSARADEPGDLGKLKWIWKATTGPNGTITAFLEVDGSKGVARLLEGDRETIKLLGTITLDEKATPKRFDFVVEGKKTSDFPAIYKLDGDTFTICTGTPSSGRPTEFKAGEQGVPALKVYRRVVVK